MKKYSVYVLIKENKPVYIGFSECIKLRISQHKRDERKDFDDYLILQSFENKNEALAAEKALFKFLLTFGTDLCLNKVEHNFIYRLFNKGMIENEQLENLTSSIKNERI